MTATPEAKTYLAPLDGIRALAILLVLAFHSTESHPLEGGYIGVDVFFVLSGFLITRQLLGRAPEFVPFMLRRLARLWPALLAMTAALVTVTTVFGDRTSLAVLLAPLYVLNIAYAHELNVGDPALVGHIWSLAIEFQFYLLWSVAMLFLRRRSPRVLLAVTAGIAVASLAVRALYALALNDMSMAYFAPEARLDGLFLGATIAVVLRDRLWSLRWAAQPVVALVVLVPALTLFAFLSDGGQLIASPLGCLVGAMLLLTVLERPEHPATSVLGSNVLVWVGFRSYSLYLWHVPIFEILQNHAGGLPTPAEVAVGWALSFVAAEASYRIVERPAREWLNARIGARGQTATHVAAPPPFGGTSL